MGPRPHFLLGLDGTGNKWAINDGTSYNTVKTGLAKRKHGCVKTRVKTVLKHCFILNKNNPIKGFSFHLDVIVVDRQAGV